MGCNGVLSIVCAGLPARQASLVYPKGIGVTAQGEIVFVDGTRLRMVNTAGILVSSCYVLIYLMIW